MIYFFFHTCILSYLNPIACANNQVVFSLKLLSSHMVSELFLVRNNNKIREQNCYAFCQQNLHCSVILTISKSIAHIPVSPLWSKFSRWCFLTTFLIDFFFVPITSSARQQAVFPNLFFRFCFSKIYCIFWTLTNRSIFMYLRSDMFNTKSMAPASINCSLCLR